MAWIQVGIILAVVIAFGVILVTSVNSTLRATLARIVIAAQSVDIVLDEQNRRLGEQGKRIDIHGRRLDNVELRIGNIESLR